MKTNMMYLALNQLGCLSLILLCSTFVIAQEDTIRLKNPSFEGTPFRGGEKEFNLKGWSDCGNILFPNETPADLHPNGFWEVDLTASEGKTYLGLVARDNATYESVTASLSSPLHANQEYQLSIFLAKSPKYISMSRTTNQPGNYSESLSFVISGGSCKETEILYFSPLIDHEDWRKYEIIIKPTKDHQKITLAVYFGDHSEFAYNGNILIDNISDIIRVK
jgi:hypothetical protein